MKTARALFVAACVAALSIAGSSLWSRAADTNPQQPGSAAPAKKASAAKVRLPNRYAKIGLSDAQREKVYAVQSKYSAEIKEIQKKLASLRERRDQEIEELLTDEQKQLLAELEAQAKAAGEPAAQVAPAEKATPEKKE